MNQACVNAGDEKAMEDYLVECKGLDKPQDHRMIEWTERRRGDRPKGEERNNEGT